MIVAVSPSVLVRLDTASVANAVAAAGSIAPAVPSADLQTAIALGLGFGSADEALVEGEQFGGVIWDGIDHGLAVFLSTVGTTCPAGALWDYLADSIVDHADLERRWHEGMGEQAAIERGRLTVLFASAQDIDGPVAERRPLDFNRDDAHAFDIAIYRKENALVFQCVVHGHDEVHALAQAGRRLGQAWRAIQVGLGLEPFAFPLRMDTDYEIEVQRRPAWEFGVEFFKLGEALLVSAFPRASGKRKLVRTAQLGQLAKLLIGTDPNVRKLWAAGRDPNFSLRWMASAPSPTMSTQISPWPNTAKEGVGLTEVTREVLQVIAFHRACNVRKARFEGRLGERCPAPTSATIRALLQHPNFRWRADIGPLTDYLTSIGLPALAERVIAQAEH